MEKGKKKRSREGKGKKRWKKDSLRKVGRTDARTNTQVILYSVQCYCIALDRQKILTY